MVEHSPIMVVEEDSNLSQRCWCEFLEWSTMVDQVLEVSTIMQSVVHLFVVRTHAVEDVQ